jgi:hypothetical protein
VRHYGLNETSEWVSVLRLATRWNFPSFRALALEKLESVEPSVDKLVLAHELNVTDWLLSSYTALCLRPEPLTLEEAERLKMSDVVLIFTAREWLKGSTDANSATACIEKLLAPKTKPAAASYADSSSVSHQPSQKVSSKETPVVELVDLSQAITDALRYHAYDDAVGLISEANADDAAVALISWINTDVNVRGVSSLQCLLTAIFRRCARDAHFASCAASILSCLTKSINENFCDEYYSPYTYSAKGQQAFITILGEVSTSIIRTTYFYSEDDLLGNDVRSYGQKKGDQVLYFERRRGALTLVRELIHMQIIGKPNMANLVLFSEIEIDKLYPELVSLSPLLDFPEVVNAVNNALDLIRNNLSAKKCSDQYTIDMKTSEWTELRVGGWTHNLVVCY